VSFVESAFAGFVSVTPGAMVSTTNVFAPLAALFPAASCCVATAVYVPSGRAVASIA